MAGSGAIAMATALGVEEGFSLLLGMGPKNRLVAMLLGAIVAMLGSIAMTAATNAWAKFRMAALFPVAIGVGMVAGVSVGGRTDLMLGVFVVVMFIAVLIRRFGPEFFFLGFMLWIGYFFASFLQAKLAMLPFLILAVVLASLWTLLLSLTVLRPHPARTLRRTVSSFDARARGLLRVCAELLRTSDAHRARPRKRLQRRLRGYERRLAEAALMVEGWAAQTSALPPGRSAETLRRQLVDAQQALDAIATTSRDLAEEGDDLRVEAARIARDLAYRDDAGAVHAARQLKQRLRRESAHFRDNPDGHVAQRSAYRFALATLAFVALARAARRPESVSEQPHEGETESFEPTANLMMGNLPGSASVAQGLSARGARWNPLARLDLTTRQAIQVAVAGGLAILVGRSISPTRYYWAVIAAFLMFSGTATRSETILKGFNRVLGTALGLFVAVVLAELTVGHPVWVIVTIVASMFCGFYLLRVSYAYTIFFITIMIAQLYTVFNEFTPGLLVLRLEETAVGAGLGFLVALLLLPLSTRDTVRSARESVLETLSRLLRAAAERLEPETRGVTSKGTTSSGLHALSRALDDRIRRFALVAKPLTQPLLGAGNYATARHRLNLHVAIATASRALVVALNEMSATPGRGLAQGARALATAADRMISVRPGQNSAKAAEALEEAEAALSDVDPASAGEDAADHAVQSLRRLLYLLKALEGRR